MFVDTHCHIDLLVKSNFNVPLTDDQVLNAYISIDRARAAGVEIIVTVGVSLTESLNCLTLAHAHKNVFATVGIHPSDITLEWKSDFDAIKNLVPLHKNKSIVGIGECGFDRKYPGLGDVQKDVFREQATLALEHNLPLIIHVREAHNEVLAALDEFKGHALKGIMHCFSGDLSFATEIINRGFYMGIGGTVTYPKNQQLRDILMALGLDRVVLETDAPFLPPQTMRGQKNEPANTKIIAEYVADLLGLDVQAVAEITTKNARAIFNFPLE